MGGIAEVLLNLGYEVQGRDLKPNAVTERLAKLGARIIIGHAAENVGERRRRGRVQRRVAAENPEVRRGAGARASRWCRAPRCSASSCASATPSRSPARTARRRPRAWSPSMLAEGGEDPTFVIGGLPEERGQQCAARRGPLPRRRGGRERRLVPAPAADDRDRHQHRQRSSRHARRRFRAAEAELRRVPAQPAVLRARRAVRATTTHVREHPAAGRTARW